ncbi:hypothetical protein FCM35_KLT10871 [Carex littledalei]|uniref:Uncharacterized protein n=1 Tax=Carex littledalei TaxID=544730 RepID=A0A833QLF3_9POAL|nr:hypothetical protein FCM35_KLT10871 [Carex littledalei]
MKFRVLLVFFCLSSCDEQRRSEIIGKGTISQQLDAFSDSLLPSLSRLLTLSIKTKNSNLLVRNTFLILLMCYFGSFEVLIRDLSFSSPILLLWFKLHFLFRFLLLAFFGVNAKH